MAQITLNSSGVASNGALVLQSNGTTTAVTISTGQVATFAQAPVLPSGSIPQAALAAGVAGTGPAFSAYRSTTQALTAYTTTKIVCDTEEFDTNNNFASGTFTPTVAGYYQINCAISASSVTNIQANIYKNGSMYKILSSSNSATIATGGGSCLVYCNGSTDYIDFYASFSTSINTVAGAQYSWFQASMVRSA